MKDKYIQYSMNFEYPDFLNTKFPRLAFSSVDKICEDYGIKKESIKVKIINIDNLNYD